LTAFFRKLTLLVVSIGVSTFYTNLRTNQMPLTIRAPVYDEAVEIEDGGYVTMREAADAEATPATNIVTPPPPAVTVFDDATFPPAPPVLVRQRAVVIDPEDADYLRGFGERLAALDAPIRTLLGDAVPIGEPLEPFPTATALPAVRAPAVGPPGGFGFGFGAAPVPSGWANGVPPYEPNDRNNPINPNRFNGMW
jgi:hypothetical protein